MWQMALKQIVFIFVICIFSLVNSLRSSNSCFADNIICIDRVREAVDKYPKYQESLLCEMKIAFIEKNKNNPIYTNCVNLAREKFAGDMKRGGVFNPVNNFNMIKALEDKRFRKALSSCIDLISDCYDVNNLRLCLSHHEHL